VVEQNLWYICSMVFNFLCPRACPSQGYREGGFQALKFFSLIHAGKFFTCTLQHTLPNKKKCSISTYEVCRYVIVFKTSKISGHTDRERNGIPEGEYCCSNVITWSLKCCHLMTTEMLPFNDYRNAAI
jgi:hypothetical protein